MRRLVLTCAIIAMAGATAAVAQSGPVATACKADIKKHCAGKGHGDRQTRTCLESKMSKLSASCKTALNSTGGGKGKNRK